MVGMSRFDFQIKQNMRIYVNSRMSLIFLLTWGFIFVMGYRYPVTGFVHWVSIGVIPFTWMTIIFHGLSQFIALDGNVLIYTQDSLGSTQKHVAIEHISHISYDKQPTHTKSPNMYLHMYDVDSNILATINTSTYRKEDIYQLILRLQMINSAIEANLHHEDLPDAQSI